jgi:AcrR family transcriptional regulator
MSQAHFIEITMSEPNRQTRRQRLEAREESIIEAAQAEFLENGFDGAKVAGIARRAGVAEGTLYLYFKNKNALLGAVVGSFYQRLTEGAASGVIQYPASAERLEFLARHHLQGCLAEWSILELAVPAFYQSGKYRDSEFFGFNRNYVAVFDNVVREGISREEIRDDLPLHMMRDLFYGALEHSVRTYMVRGRDLENEQAIANAASQVMEMVRPAFGLQIIEKSTLESNLQSVAQRLENIAARLEIARPIN